MRYLIWSLIFLFLVCGCALPPSEDAPVDSWVPEDEILTVNYVKEGMAYFAAGRLIDAEFSFLKGLYLHPEADNIRINLAVVFEKQRRFDEALSIMKKLSFRYPEAFRYRVAAARLYYLSGYYDEALSKYKALINEALAASAPQVVPGNLEESGVEERRRVEVEQEERDKKAAMLPSLYRSISALSYLIGDEESSLCYSLLENVLNPDPAAKLRYIRLLNGLGMSGRAVEYIHDLNAVSTIKSNPEVLLELVLAEMDLSKYENAKKFAEIGLKTTSADPGVLYNLRLLDILSSIALEEEFDEERQKEADEIFSELFLRDKDTLDRMVLYWPEGPAKLLFRELEKIASVDK